MRRLRTTRGFRIRQLFAGVAMAGTYPERMPWFVQGLDVRRRATENLSLIQQSTEDHTRIAQAIMAKDPDKAAHEMGVHLDHIEETTRHAMEAEMSSLARTANADRRVRRLTGR
jgi:DNA-binding FadR family transcriptional regulator